MGQLLFCPTLFIVFFRKNAIFYYGIFASSFFRSANVINVTLPLLSTFTNFSPVATVVVVGCAFNFFVFFTAMIYEIKLFVKLYGSGLYLPDGKPANIPSPTHLYYHIYIQEVKPCLGQ